MAAIRQVFGVARLGLMSSAIRSISSIPGTLPKPDTTNHHHPLVDTYGRYHDYLRISLTERCNLRCQYCMPAEGVALTPDERLLSLSELERIVKVFANLGVQKIRLTGGEPLVRRDLVDIIAMLNNIPGIEDIHMTTNGLTLSRKLSQLKDAGLNGLNISLDTLQSHKFQFITRRSHNGLNKVLDSIHHAVAMEIKHVKVNCVVMKGLNDDEITDFVRFSSQLPVEVRFIEYMPFTGNKWNFDKFLTYRDMLADVMRVWPNLIKIQDGKNDTAKSYQVPGFLGSVGFIASMSNHFCSSCNRLRITADGNLKVCLFGNAEVSLRDVLRGGASDDDLTQCIATAVSRKKKQHAGMFNLSKMDNRPMILIDTQSHTHNIFSINNNHILLNKAITGLSSLSNLFSRYFSSFSHITDSGKANMVDITHKPITSRCAIASGKIYLTDEAIEMIANDQRSHKGSVLGVAEIAAIFAMKKTSDIIPLCHSLPLTHVGVAWDIRHSEQCVVVMVTASTEARTGVEMEALLGVTVALVTVYDMTKSVSHKHIISDIRLEEKSGGKSGHTHFHQAN